MINLSHEEGCAPIYKTINSACADVFAKEDTYLPALTISGHGDQAQDIIMPPVILVPTGLRIVSVQLDQYKGTFVPELQLRARSGLSAEGIMLANGMGTIDADYRQEILVPLMNMSNKAITIKRGESIAQITLGLRAKLYSATTEEVERSGGFGSTDKKIDIIRP